MTSRGYRIKRLLLAGAAGVCARWSRVRRRLCGIGRNSSSGVCVTECEPECRRHLVCDGAVLDHKCRGGERSAR